MLPHVKQKKCLIFRKSPLIFVYINIYCVDKKNINQIMQWGSLMIYRRHIHHAQNFGKDHAVSTNTNSSWVRIRKFSTKVNSCFEYHLIHTLPVLLGQRRLQMLLDGTNYPVLPHPLPIETERWRWFLSHAPTRFLKFDW